MKELKAQLADSNPEIVSQQKELIVDLKARLNVLDKELLLVTAGTSKELADLRK